MTTATQIAGRDAHAFLTGRRDQGRIFRKAMRHSRAVRVLRLAIPLSVAVGCAGIFAIFTLLDPWSELQRAPSIAGVLVSGTKITMRQPKLGGFTKDKRPYTVTARSAQQDITNPDVLELDDIRAVVSTADQGNVELIAQHGIYDGKAERLSLKRSIVVKSPAYTARLTEAQVGVKSGHVLSEQPVEVDMLQGTINSNRLEVIDNGDILVFDNGVTMVINRDPGADATKTAVR